MVEKSYPKPQETLDDSIALGAMILKSGFRPDVIIALWRGGTPIGIAVQEFLDYYGGCNSDNIAIRTSSYHGIGGRRDTVDIYGMSYLLKNLDRDDKVLIVDDIFDTGKTIKAVIDQLTEKARKNTPQDIRIAVPYYKPDANLTDRIPDYYLHTTDKWVNFPYSIEGLTKEEIRDNIPEVYEIIKSAI
ncbi:MAG: hypoxanthine phosphoribosyltransferase [Hyphomonadaceae bacterium]|nr:hypoxanthine phosphoribosyltransferase [Hyphomonadaceae bacterium]